MNDEVVVAKAKSWKTCELTQDCSYGWSVENVEKFIDWSVVKDYAFILHDKDKKDDMSTDRLPHVHLMLRFNCAVPTTAIVARAKKIGLPDDCIKPNTIEKMKSWSGALNYLTHRDEHKPWKFVYELDAVKSNFDWQLDAEVAHQKKLIEKSLPRAKEIVELIDNGTIKHYNIDEYLTAWESNIYSDYINKAFRRVSDKKKRIGERNMNVIFVSGGSGCGKDVFATTLCRERGFEFYPTSNNDVHPFDDYKGQPAIIWRDARDDVFKPKNLFALLDNHWNCSQSARYYDVDLNCKLFVITSIKPITEWYKKALDDIGEDRWQLYRRIGAWVDISEDFIRYSVLDKRIRGYKFYKFEPNTFIKDEWELDTDEKQDDYMREMFGDLIDYDDMSNSYQNTGYFEDVKDVEIIDEQTKLSAE